jgi:His/Glu/Gln/Arg/opine family amino acid ABC transporter permease subunit
VEEITMDYPFNFIPVFDAMPSLLRGVVVTLEITGLSLLLAVILGLIAGQLRLSRSRWIRLPVTVYIDFFRTTPMLVQLVWIFYVVPIVMGIKATAFQSGVIALSLNYAAFFAEIFRAGVTSISYGQTYAGAALGMTNFQIMRRIIYPQVFRRMLPPLGSMTVSLLKDSSLVSVIGIADLMHAGQNVIAWTFRSIEAMTVVAFLYLFMTYPIAWFSDYLHKRSGYESHGG